MDQRNPNQATSHARAIGFHYTDINKILRNIRRRPSGEPTAKERAELLRLRAELQALRRGESL